MKSRILFLAALFSILTYTVSAQSAQIRAGVNFANISVTSDGAVDDAKQLTSFQFGIIGDLPLGADFISLQPGILFTGKGSKTEIGDASNPYTSYQKATFNPKYIEIPANLVFKLQLEKDNKIFVGAGPYVGIGISGKRKVSGRAFGGNLEYNRESNIRFSNDDPSTTNIDEGAGFGILRRFDYGMNGTAGIESNAVVLSVNYGYGLAKLQSGSNAAKDDYNKHRVLSLTAGFKF